MAKDITGGIVGKNSMLGVALTLAITVCIIIIVVKIYKAMQVGTKAIGGQLGNQIISVQTGIPAARIDFLKDVAKQANKGVYRIWGLNKITWVIDEDVVNACNQAVNVAEAALVSQFYKQDTGDSLRYDVIESSFMTDSSRNKILYKNSFK